MILTTKTIFLRGIMVLNKALLLGIFKSNFLFFSILLQSSESGF